MGTVGQTRSLRSPVRNTLTGFERLWRFLDLSTRLDSMGLMSNLGARTFYRAIL
jgi:hypothetical protein